MKKLSLLFVALLTATVMNLQAATTDYLHSSGAKNLPNHVTSPKKSGTQVFASWDFIGDSIDGHAGALLQDKMIDGDTLVDNGISLFYYGVDVATKPLQKEKAQGLYWRRSTAVDRAIVMTVPGGEKAIVKYALRPGKTNNNYRFYLFAQDAGTTPATFHGNWSKAIDSVDWQCAEYTKDTISINVDLTAKTKAQDLYLLFLDLGGADKKDNRLRGVSYEVKAPDMHDFLHFVGLNGNDTVRLDKHADESTLADFTATFEYSKDRINWDNVTWATTADPVYTYQGNPIALNQGDTVFFRAKGTNGLNTTINQNLAFFCFAFGTDDSIAAGGNIMSLYDASCTQDTMTAYGFHSLFSEDYQLVSPPKLPAKKMAWECYRAMFDGCTSLTTAPELPATDLGLYCYKWMFRNCKSLTVAPKLAATTVETGCYIGMFEGCKSLTTAPKLPAESAGSESYRGMFSGCSSLTTAPELPATSIAPSCYREMFKNCTSLTTAPELSATLMEENCYCDMFSGCTSLTTAPTLAATKLCKGCYSGMFSNCTKLAVYHFSVTCDGAEMEMPTYIDPIVGGSGWNSGMFYHCQGDTALTNMSGIQTGGHYCVKEYVPAPVVETYGRKVTNGNFGTICLAKKFNATEGVEGLYVPYEVKNDTLYCEEVALKDIEAGYAYIFKANADSVTFALDGEAVSAAIEANNMLGWLDADKTIDDAFLTTYANYYMLGIPEGQTTQQIVKPLASSTLKQNRAMITLPGAPSAPLRGRLVAFGLNGTDAATGMDQVAGGRLQVAEKCMVNGQLVIIRDGKMFNAQGQEL